MTKIEKDTFDLVVKKIFFRFLKEKDALVPYFKNTSEDYGTNTNTHINDVLRDSPRELVNFAFCWSETPEGHAFWRSISEQWKELLWEVIKRQCS